MMLADFVEYFSLKSHLIIGYILRCFFICWGLIQDQLDYLPYTDIDYTVFTDGARYLHQGRSPFLRHGYRYSPAFAFLLLPNVFAFKQFGKFLFAGFDIACGCLIYQLLVNKKIKCPPQIALSAAAFWIYNPLPIVISTRGSGDSLITFLILLTCRFLLSEMFIVSGLIYGLAIHCKLYPVIYSLPIYLYLACDVKSVFSFKTWSPFSLDRFAFFSSAIISFSSLTNFSYQKYGLLYLQEAWLYHIYRRDTAHNFSPYFYIYKKVKDENNLKFLSLMAFIPQILAIIYFSIRYCIAHNQAVKDRNLMFALFAATYSFVTFNKVVTSQYFIWYLSLLPVVLPFLKMSTKFSFKLFSIWLFAQLQWLIVAYLYQYQRWQVLNILVICSLIFVWTNMILLSIIMRHYKPELAREHTE